MSSRCTGPIPLLKLPLILPSAATVISCGRLEGWSLHSPNFGASTKSNGRGGTGPVNEKLARVHLHPDMGPGQTNLPNPDLTKPPFTFRDGIAEFADPR